MITQTQLQTLEKGTKIRFKIIRQHWSYYGFSDRWYCGVIDCCGNAIAFKNDKGKVLRFSCSVTWMMDCVLGHLPVPEYTP